MSKQIVINSGSIIRRIPDGPYNEIWEMESKVYAQTIVSLDLSNWSGVTVAGFEGQMRAEAFVGPQETREIFYIIREPPFRFAADISFEEVPLSHHEQDLYNEPIVKEVGDKIQKMKDWLGGVAFEVLEEDDLKRKIKEAGFDHFVDFSFPPDESSIWSPELEGSYPLKEKPVWKRPHQFMNKTPSLFEGGIDPNDINQGALGDWWFLAALASIAENPALVRRLFITKEYNEEGIYKLKICKNGEWITVIIDDYIPCFINGGPMFARNKGDELWVILLEKAYAKLHGDYCQLRSGILAHGMGDLTGCPIDHNPFPTDRHTFYLIEDFAQDLWGKLEVADIKGYIMWASTPGVDMYTEGGGPNQDNGIVPGHAYSVIAVKSYQGIQLLEIRNPWGEFEWGGAWSDNSREWTPELIEVFKPNFDSQDGTFWMCYQDFFKYFNAVTICKVNNWDELRMRGKFLRLWENEDPDEDWVLSKFYYSFRLSEQTEINIGLHQEDERCMRGRQKEMAKSGSSHISPKSFYLDLHIIILKRNNNGSITLVHESESDLDREVYTSVTLKPGHYIVIPRTSGGSLNAVESGSSSHYSYHVPYGHGERLHTYMNSIFGDIFSKMDLQLNGQLSAQELNQFGEIIDDDELKSIKMADFFSEKFWNISCDENGFTKYGFIQYLSQFSDDRIHNMLTKLGYNEDLYSTKSRVFTLSFHWAKKLRVRIGDAMKTDLNERAWDLMMDKHNQQFGATKALSNDHCIVFRIHRDQSHSVDYAAINKTDEYIEINFRQDQSENMNFSPSKGSVRSVIPPRGLIYLASAVVKPGCGSYKYSYSFRSDYC